MMHGLTNLKIAIEVRLLGKKITIGTGLTEG
jgi:hypothetical protein